MQQPDKLHRFTFADLPLRGELVTLTQSFREIRDRHQYPPAISALLGEALAAVALMTATVKFEGRLTLQLQSASTLKLLLVECNHLGHVRGLAQLRDGAEPGGADFRELVAGGQMAITIEPDQGKRYQGVVPLSGDNLAACLEDYFLRSEQLATRIRLLVNNEAAFGLLLQNLPEHQGTDALAHAGHLAETLSLEEALSLEHEDLLYRLYHQDKVTLFKPQPVRFNCSCSRERTLRALDSVDPEELQKILAEDGAVEMTCDFCSTVYRFLPADLSAGTDGQGSEPTLH